MQNLKILPAALLGQSFLVTVYADPLSIGGASNGHYKGNAKTYMNVGLGDGKAAQDVM
jgi:hypothetical protein